MAEEEANGRAAETPESSETPKSPESLRPGIPAPRGDGFDTGAILERLAQAKAALSRERQEAPALVEELLSGPADAQRERAVAAPRFRTWGVCELLLEKGLAAEEPDPAESGRLAALALAVAGLLDGTVHARAVVEDLRARAWAGVGETRRRAGDAAGAEEALRAAAACLADGTGDLLVEARLLEFEAALRLDQRRPGEADSLLRQAAARYKQVHEVHLLERVTAKRNRILDEVREARGLARFAKPFS
jgi:hypothetical protein